MKKKNFKKIGSFCLVAFCVICLSANILALPNNKEEAETTTEEATAVAAENSAGSAKAVALKAASSKEAEADGKAEKADASPEKDKTEKENSDKEDTEEEDTEKDTEEKATTEKKKPTTEKKTEEVKVTTEKKKTTTEKKKTTTEKKTESTTEKKKAKDKKKDKDKDKDKKTSMKAEDIKAPEDVVRKSSTLAVETDKKLHLELEKLQSYQTTLDNSETTKAAISDFYARLEKLSKEHNSSTIVSLTGVERDDNSIITTDSSVNDLLNTLAEKTKNSYLKHVLSEYTFDINGEFNVDSALNQKDFIQLKPYLDEQLGTCVKTITERQKEATLNLLKIKRVSEQISYVNAEQERVFNPTNLLEKSNLTIAEIQQMLKGTALEELAPAYYQCEQKYGVNAVFVMSISIHESAWGTSRRAREDNNLTGYGVTSDSAEGINANTKENNLLMTAKLLKEKYLVPSGAYHHGTSVKSVNQCYCVGSEWAGAVTNFGYDLMKKL